MLALACAPQGLPRAFGVKHQIDWGPHPCEGCLEAEKLEIYFIFFLYSVFCLLCFPSLLAFPCLQQGESYLQRRGICQELHSARHLFLAHFRKQLAGGACE